MIAYLENSSCGHLSISERYRGNDGNAFGASEARRWNDGHGRVDVEILVPWSVVNIESRRVRYLC